MGAPGASRVVAAAANPVTRASCRPVPPASSLAQRGIQFAETSTRARQTIAQLGARFIRTNAVVLTHGYSRVVLALLQAAAAQVCGGWEDGSGGQQRSDRSHQGRRGLRDDAASHGLVGGCCRCCATTRVQGTHFSVVVTEGRPDATGLRMAKALSDIGIPVTLVHDSGVAWVLER